MGPLKNCLESFRRQDLETYAECFWVELKVPCGNNLLISRCYVDPSTFLLHLDKYLSSLVIKINKTTYDVTLGDFNDSGYNWHSNTFFSS